MTLQSAIRIIWSRVSRTLSVYQSTDGRFTVRPAVWAGTRVAAWEAMDHTTGAWVRGNGTDARCTRGTLFSRLADAKFRCAQIAADHEDA